MDTDVTHIGTWPPEGAAPTVDHLVAIVRAAELAGFEGLLVPTSYHNTLDNFTTAAAVLAHTGSAHLLLAIRPHQYHPTHAAMMLASLGTLFPGRIRINVTTGGWDEDRWIGNDEDRATRSARLEEWLEVLTSVLYGTKPLRHSGRFYSADGARLRSPLRDRLHIAMSGSSPQSRRTLARFGSEYLMFAAPPDDVRAEIARLRSTPGCEAVAATMRVHLIVRPTEDEARRAADDLVSRVDPRVREKIRAQRHEATSQRTRQNELAASEDLYVAPNLWAGVGTGRFGAATALVGSPDQIADRLAEYQEAGVRGFILSGYPKLEECRRFENLMTPVLRERGLLVTSDMP
ncbi:LLM class flavin-dependent oxidoreductase [Spirillospora sp. CA-142024]|uniref:LLM class flavin-dependent oxidoreductase n=1 Tax=Spirillospora sp. CA-142024 TaxID=3240036 RepID=UPI003D90D897